MELHRRFFLACTCLALTMPLAHAAEAVPLLPLAREAVVQLPKLPQRATDAFVAVDTAMADFVFTWAEQNLPSYFSPANAPAQNQSGYYYRAYQNNAYLAVANQNSEFFAVTGGNVIDVGKLSDFAGKVGYKPAGSSTMTVGKALDYEYARAVIQWQVDNATYTADPTSLGVSMSSTGASVAGVVTIKINQALSQGTPGFITFSCYRCHNWKLTYNQFLDFANEMDNDTYFNRSLTYLDNADLNGYMTYTQSQLGNYNTLVSQIPASFSTYWY